MEALIKNLPLENNNLEQIETVKNLLDLKEGKRERKKERKKERKREREKEREKERERKKTIQNPKASISFKLFYKIEKEETF